jgi:hypothetical protein
MRLKALADSALLEAAQLRNLEPPENGDIGYLRAWLRPEFGGKGLEDSDRTCWDSENHDDLVSLKSQLQKGNRFIMGMKFTLQTIQYKLWGYQKVSRRAKSCN